MQDDIFSKVSMLALEHMPDKDTRDLFLNKFAILLNDYTITAATTELVVYDDQDLKIMNLFLGTKAVEGLSKRSIQFYGYTLSMLKRDFLKPITELTTTDIRSWLAKGMVERNWKSTTANNFRHVLMSFYGWAYNEKHISDNPMVRIKEVKGKKQARTPLTEEEIEQLRNAASVRDRAIIEVLLSTGCRINELTGLSRKDVDFRSGKAKVLGKGNKERWVYFNRKAAMYLERYLDTRKDDSPALFVSKNTKTAITNDGVRNMLHKLGEQLGIKKVHPHRFRHTAATTALRRGMPIEMIQQVLGHEQINTTMIYAHSNVEEVQENHRKYLN